MTFTGMGPDAPSPRLDPNCQCDCHRQPGVMHVAACCQAKAPASDAVTLSEVQALIAANYRKLVAEITGNPSGTRCDACRSCGYYHCVDAFSGCAGMRDYTLDEATTAIAARDEQMRAEGRVAGLREAAEVAGLNAWKHAGEDDYSRGMDAGAYHQVRACCDAIRAHADKIEGEANG